MRTNEVISQSRLSLELRPLSIKKLIYLTSAPGDIYIFENKLFSPVIKTNDGINRDIIKTLLEKKFHTLYVDYPTFQEIHRIINNYLIKMTRSLSTGDPIKKGPAQMNLLSMNMANIYQDTANTEIIKMQHQSSIIFGKFLIDHKDLIDNFYKSFELQGHHYTLAQPMLSSLLLIGFLAKHKLFSVAEMEKLYITSYFKDIGMGLLPQDKFEGKNPNPDDKSQISQHAEKSVDLLRGRIPLEEDQLNLIAHHHDIINNPNLDEITFGFESLIVSVTDVITAMLSERPYRGRRSLYETLEYLKHIFGDEYFSEFKLLVHYLRNFFK